MKKIITYKSILYSLESPHSRKKEVSHIHFAISVFTLFWYMSFENYKILYYPMYRFAVLSKTLKKQKNMGTKNYRIVVLMSL